MMTSSHLVRTTIAILSALASVATSAVTPNPTPQRAYVSLSGSDANSCGPTAPCRTFQAALAQVNPDGEVLVLDSGAYGTMTITQGVTVTAPPGVYAGISVFGGDGVTINAPGAKVMLKGLTINGLGGNNGVNFVDGAALTVEDCLVSNMSLNGIQVVATTAPNIFLSNTKVRANGQSGIYLEGAMHAILDGVRAEANLYGVYARSGPSVTIRNSTASGNGGFGFALEASTASTTMLVSNSASLHNGDGIGMDGDVSSVVQLTVESSVIEGNRNAGIHGQFNGAINNGSGGLTVEHTKIIGNTNGIFYYSPSGFTRAMIAHNLIDDNHEYGVYMPGPGTIATFTANIVSNSYGGILIDTQGKGYTRGDNTFDGNVTNILGTLIPRAGL